MHPPADKVFFSKKTLSKRRNIENKYYEKFAMQKAGEPSSTELFLARKSSSKKKHIGFKQKEKSSESLGPGSIIMR